MADGKEIPREETLEVSSDEDTKDELNAGGTDATVKAFKDLVG